MTATEWLTHDQFAPRVGEAFTVEAGDTGYEVALVEAQESTEMGAPGPRGEQRRQFSLVFRGPVEPLLPQATYLVRHPDLGALELFLVPIGRDAESVRYEAAFA